MKIRYKIVPRQALRAGPLKKETDRETVKLIYYDFRRFCEYSKASRYTASRSTDLGDTRFLIGSQNT